MTTSLSHIELLGELRAALQRYPIQDFDPAIDRKPKQPSIIGTIGYCLAMLSRHEEALTMLSPLLPKEHGGAPFELWVSFLIAGRDALVERIADEAPWITNPRLAAAQWLGAWLWQCVVQNHPRSTKELIEHNGMHVCMGLGGLSRDDEPPNAFLAMEWLPQENHAAGMIRHVALHVREGALGAGEFNVRGALLGYGGLPEHLPRFELQLFEAP